MKNFRLLRPRSMPRAWVGLATEATFEYSLEHRRQQDGRGAKDQHDSSIQPAYRQPHAPPAERELIRDHRAPNFEREDPSIYSACPMRKALERQYRPARQQHEQAQLGDFLVALSRRGNIPTRRAIQPQHGAPAKKSD